jgi:hypothetical protein
MDCLTLEDGMDSLSLNVGKLLYVTSQKSEDLKLNGGGSLNGRNERPH